MINVVLPGVKRNIKLNRIERAKAEALTALVSGKVLGGSSAKSRVNSIKRAYKFGGKGLVSAINASIIARERRAKKLKRIHSAQVGLNKDRQALGLSSLSLKSKK